MTELDWIDISVPLHTGMVHWPGDPEFCISRQSDIRKGDPATVSRLCLGAHPGTHMDAPAHFFLKTTGAMTNMGLYTEPRRTGLKSRRLAALGKIQESRKTYAQMIELSVANMVYVTSELYEKGGCDGINIDTTTAAGCAEYYAALKAVETLRAKYPDMGIEMGMSGEFILGMHGEIEYNGVRLAGLYPQDQVKLAEQAGVTILGPAINIVTQQSLPWNVARSIT